MTQVSNNFVMTGMMLIISAIIVFSYHEYIDSKMNSKLKEVYTQMRSQKTEMKFIDDGRSEPRLMIKNGVEPGWKLVPMEYSEDRLYYPLELMKPK